MDGAGMEFIEEEFRARIAAEGCTCGEALELMIHGTGKVDIDGEITAVGFHVHMKHINTCELLMKSKASLN